MGSTTQPTQTTTQVLSPEQQALLKLAMPGVTKYAESSPPSAYPGSSVAGFTPVQEKSQADILAAADRAAGIQNWAQTGAEAIPGSLEASKVATSSDIFNDPGIWNPQYNTGLQSAIEAAQRPTWNNLLEQILPSIRSGAGAGPGYGGSRQGIAEGLAIGRGTQTAADQAAKIVEELYGTNLAALGTRYGQNVQADVTQRGQDLNTLLATYGMAPSLESQAYGPGTAEAAVGAQQQQQEQNVLNDAIAKYYYNQPGVAPFLQSQQILALLGGLPGGSVTSTGNVPTSPTAGRVASSAISGAAAGAPFGPIGAGVGAVAGGVLPFAFPT